MSSISSLILIMAQQNLSLHAAGRFVSARDQLEPAYDPNAPFALSNRPQNYPSQRDKADKIPTHPELSSYPQSRPPPSKTWPTTRLQAATGTEALLLDENCKAPPCCGDGVCVFYLSNSALSSDSVGSIMSVPGTGHDMVGLWNP